ncbi:FkbM family methyltransferase [Magnetococcales bacterium HHB-1]
MIEIDNMILQDGETKVDRAFVTAKINPNISPSHLKPFHAVGECPPQQLLNGNRLDVIAKYVYAYHRDLRAALAWGLKVYQDHLGAITDQRFQEGDGQKYAFSDYQEKFDQLLESMAQEGFLAEKGLLPIDQENDIVDGAHRLAAALYYQCTIHYVRFKKSPHRFDYRFFLQRGLSRDILDHLILHYVKLNSTVRIAVLFPVADDHNQNVVPLLESCGRCFYERALHFTRQGRVNLIRLLYQGEAWLGDGKEETSGLQQHLYNRFKGDHPVRFFFFECADLEKSLRVKKQIRDHFKMGNDSIHINDTYEESVRISESLLNQNGVHLLNHGQSGQTENFDHLFVLFKQWLQEQKLDRERFCIDGSSAMAVYGLRDAADIDYLSHGYETESCPYQYINCHNSELGFHERSLDQLIFDPANYFYFEGIKFISLKTLRHMKARRGEFKDQKDVQDIDHVDLEKSLMYRVRQFLWQVKEARFNMRYRLVQGIKKRLPASLYPMAKALYRAPKTVKMWLGPSEQQMAYRGFTLHYRKGTSLIAGICNGQIYEQHLSLKLAEFLREKERPVLLDIGANIGLITLNMVHDVGDIQIHAFEPGVDQLVYLKRNITENNLDHQVTCYDQAVGAEVGETTFFVHGHKHSSGDGFINTQRAGEGKTVQVKVTTLDHWWEEAGKPDVDVIKVDTEGAEYLVFQGGEKLLSQIKPVIIFEMDSRNLKAYPHTGEDVCNLLWQQSYTIHTTTGTTVTKENLPDLLTLGVDFMAV